MQLFVGLLLGSLCVGTVAAAARRLRARLLPGWSGPAAVVASVVGTWSLLLLALELAGVVGAFTRAGVLVSCLLTAALASWAAARGHPGTRPPGPGAQRWPLRRPWVTTGTAVAVAVAAAPWLGWTIYSLRHGMEAVDTLWYHLPAAGRFVQDGSILALHPFDRDPVTVFYPNSSELLHAFALLMLRTDAASAVINLGWLALALVAAWSVGERFGRGPHCLLAALPVLASPALIVTQAGNALDDVVCLALTLAAAGLLVSGWREDEGGVSPGAGLFAAAAAGLGLGTKLSMVAPAVLLALAGMLMAPPGRRRRRAVVSLAALVLLGGLWYLRNTIHSGNPLPPLHLHLGPISLPSVNGGAGSDIVARYLGDTRLWRPIFVAGLRQSLGPAWWLLLLGAFGGWLGALASGERWLRLLGGAGLLAGIAFLFTPQYLGLPASGLFFTANLRYAEMALILGLVLLPLVRPLRGRRAGALLLALGGLALALTELDPAVWGVHLGTLAPIAPALHGGPAVGGAAAAAAGLIGWLAVWLRRWRRRRGLLPQARGGRLALVATALAAGLTLAWVVTDAYNHRRYRATLPLPQIFHWAQGIHHARIALVGVTLQYPLYGSDATNYVQYLVAPQAHAGFGPIMDCRAWRRAVDAGRYRWVLVAPFGFPLGSAQTQAPEWRWMAGTPATPVVQETANLGERAVLFEVRGPLDPSTCPA